MARARRQSPATGPTQAGARYMIEVPNRIRIYYANPSFVRSIELLFNLLEKYGVILNAAPSTSAMLQVRPEQRRSMTQLLTTLQCPECASSGIVADDEHGEVARAGDCCPGREVLRAQTSLKVSFVHFLHREGD